MKKILTKVLLLACIPCAANASVCSVAGNVKSIVPSLGVAGLVLDAPITGCNCDGDYLWIDTETGGGKAMYSAVLSAKIAGLPVHATFQDGLGQGAPGNTSVTYRRWATCKLQSLSID